MTYIKAIGTIVKRRYDSKNCYLTNKNNGGVSIIISHDNCPICEKVGELREVLEPSLSQLRRRGYWTEFFRCECGYNCTGGKKILNRKWGQK